MTKEELNALGIEEKANYFTKQAQQYEKDHNCSRREALRAVKKMHKEDARAAFVARGALHPIPNS